MPAERPRSREAARFGLAGLLRFRGTLTLISAFVPLRDEVGKNCPSVHVDDTSRGVTRPRRGHRLWDRRPRSGPERADEEGSWRLRTICHPASAEFAADSRGNK